MSRKKRKNCCLFEIQIGERLIHSRSGRNGVLRQIALTPNGVSDQRILAVLYVEFDDGSGVTATSDKFTPDPDAEYDDHYPSLMCNGGPQ